MFDPGIDQAAGLRRLFAAPAMSLLPIGCILGDAQDRSTAAAVASALADAGRRPLLLDLLGDDRLLDAGRGAAGLLELVELLARPGRHRGLGCDTIVLAADPLRLADLAAGLTDRMLLLAPVDRESLAHTYSQIKAVGLAHGLSHHVVAFRGAGSSECALAAHRRLADTAARYLDARIDFGGVVGACAGGSRDQLAREVLHWICPIGARRGQAMN